MKNKKSDTPLKVVKRLLTQAQEIYKKLEEFKDELAIDVHKLEVQSAEQPEIFCNCSDLVADLSYIENAAKVQIDAFHANLDSKIRQEPKKYGIEKFVEAAVKGAINKNPVYLKIQDLALRINTILKKGNGLLGAIDQRRSMLKVEQALFVADYFNKDAVVDYTETRKRTQKAEKIKAQLQEMHEDEKEDEF
jgi:hypothetical protein